MINDLYHINLISVKPNRKCLNKYNMNQDFFVHIFVQCGVTKPQNHSVQLRNNVFTMYCPNLYIGHIVISPSCSTALCGAGATDGCLCVSVCFVVSFLLNKCVICESCWLSYTGEELMNIRGKTPADLLPALLIPSSVLLDFLFKGALTPAHVVKRCRRGKRCACVPLSTGSPHTVARNISF